MLNPLIAAFDGSAGSETAAYWAADEAVRRRVPLLLVHVGPWLAPVTPSQDRSGDARDAAAMLDGVQQQIQHRQPGLLVETRLVEGPVIEALVTVAGEGEALVLGARGLGGFAELLVGSVSLTTAGHCRVPAIVVPSDRRSRPTAPHGLPSAPEVVVGVDTLSPSAAVIGFAFAEAALRGARLRAVHGWDLPPSWSSLGWAPPITPGAEHEQAEAELLHKTLEDWSERFPGVDVIEDLRIGGVAATLVDASAGTDLVVVGRRLHPRFAGMGLGPAAHAVIHHSRAPIAVVPHP